MINNQLQIFESQDFGQVRVILRDGQPWFVGKDVAERLGYQKARNAITRHVDEEDKQDAPFQGDLGGTQNMTIINESGLYSLILSSKLPQAKLFKRWVTSEVLPAIRKHGGYLTPESVEQALTDPDFIIKLAISLKEERAKRLVAEQQLQAVRPKVTYYDAYMSAENSYTVTEVAAAMGTSCTALYKALCQAGWLVKPKGMSHVIAQTAPDGVFIMKKSYFGGKLRGEQLRVTTNGFKVIIDTFGDN